MFTAHIPWRKSNAEEKGRRKKRRGESLDTHQSRMLRRVGVDVCCRDAAVCCRPSALEPFQSLFVVFSGAFPLITVKCRSESMGGGGKNILQDYKIVTGRGKKLTGL